ncbi:MAG TPA: DUF692 domain-containing protein [Burkholderiales bacterium]|nr:DUF692 domain-containing protein [Burkholderiales bacterium]
MLPPGAGVSLKHAHCAQVRAAPALPAFFEVHAENYLGAGGPGHRMLTWVRERRPLSLHGVGLSIGGEESIDARHLERIAALVERYEPAAFSEHLAWSAHGGVYHNDLLPVCYDADMLARVCRHVDQVQDRLKRRLLIENPSTYLEFESSTMDEPTFISEVLARTGCGLLLDVSNAVVSCTNHGRDVQAYLQALPLDAVRELHLAGHAVETDVDGRELLIDTHDRPVPNRVWALYEQLLPQLGPVATLVEWDNDLPDFATLCREAAAAERRLAAVHSTLAIAT